MKSLSWLEWLNPASWSALATKIVVGALLVLGLAFAVVWKVKSWVDARVMEKEQLTTAIAEIATLKAENSQLSQVNKALNEKQRRIQKDNSDAANAAVSARSLHDAAKLAQHRAEVSLASCLQYSSTITELFQKLDDFAGRVAREADGHVTDKIACFEAFPQL